MELWLETAVQWMLGPETQVRSWPRSQVITQFRAAPTAQPSLAVSEPATPSITHVWPRWIFLRALGLIYFSAFYSLLFQIRGLIGPDGILSANEYLEAVAAHFGGATRYWFAPTLLWISSGN